MDRRILVPVVALLLGAGVVAAEDGASGLRVTESGVGTGIVDRQLDGESDEFPENSTVYYWTRVVGGEDGDRIRHVWIRDGEEVVSIGLNIGGAHWRTYSSKMLHKGAAGPWVVETRDDEDRVLARSEFTCTSAAMR